MLSMQAYVLKYVNKAVMMNVYDLARECVDDNLTGEDAIDISFHLQLRIY